jgi:hypothetical protein
MRRTRLVVALAAAAPNTAAADCPATPDAPACRPWTAALLPSAFTAAYLPADGSGPWLGGGLELALLTWSDSAPSFGPSHGKLRIDVGVLAADHGDRGAMVNARGGAEVSLERSAARQVLIPYFVADGGTVWTRATGTRVVVDGGLGVYLWHARSAIVALEVVAVLPLTDPGSLGGARAQLTGSLAAW